MGFISENSRYITTSDSCEYQDTCITTVSQFESRAKPEGLPCADSFIKVGTSSTWDAFDACALESAAVFLKVFQNQSLLHENRGLAVIITRTIANRVFFVACRLFFFLRCDGADEHVTCLFAL